MISNTIQNEELKIWCGDTFVDVQIAEFLVKDSPQSLAVMQGLSGTLVTHGAIWQKLQAADRVDKLLALLNLPQ